jgi:hypothetical protein
MHLRKRAAAKRSVAPPPGWRRIANQWAPA